MTPWRAHTLLFLTVCIVTSAAWGDESITFSVNLVVDETEATSIGRATYQAPSLCLDCRHMGNHRLNGGSASASWSLPARDIYERQLSEFVPTQPTCYVGFIEGWGSAGFYGSQQTVQKCSPCVLYVGTFGSGSVSGAPIGRSSYNCGTSITLTATPATGWRFVRWGGNFSSDSSSITFTLDASKSVDAFFEEIPPPEPPPDDPGGGGAPQTGLPEPLILDLNGDGIHTTAVEHAPVSFDLTGDGVPETVGWTDPATDDAFLYFDLNGNHVIDGGQELFGDATLLPDGTRARSGYDALAAYDELARGGDGDGAITPRDGIWGRIRLWVDTNHDGAMSRDEDYSLASRGVVALPLAYEQLPIDDPAAVDASGNVHFQQGAFTQRLLGHGERLVQRRAHCVMFRALFR